MKKVEDVLSAKHFDLVKSNVGLKQTLKEGIESLTKGIEHYEWSIERRKRKIEECKDARDILINHLKKEGK